MKTKLLRKLRKNLKIIARETVEDQVPAIHYTLYRQEDLSGNWKIVTMSFNFKYVLMSYLNRFYDNLISYKKSLMVNKKQKEYQILP